MLKLTHHDSFGLAGNPSRRRAQLLALYALGVVTGRQFMRYYYRYQSPGRPYATNTAGRIG